MADPQAKATEVIIADRVAVAVDAQAKPVAGAVFDIPDDQHDVEVLLHKATAQDPTIFADPNTHVAFVVFASPDGGQTWEHVMSRTTNGGLDPTDLGAFAYMGFRLDPAVRSRKIRVHVTPICGPATSIPISVKVR